MLRIGEDIDHREEVRGSQHRKSCRTKCPRVPRSQEPEIKVELQGNANYFEMFELKANMP